MSAFFQNSSLVKSCLVIVCHAARQLELFRELHSILLNRFTDLKLPFYNGCKILLFQVAEKRYVPPRWILEPTDTYAVAGRSAIIDCQADGVPQPHVRWKVATGTYPPLLSYNHPPDRFKTIVSSSHVHILVNGSLNFRSVETSDAGFYLCEANNGVGSGISTVVRFTVHSAPQFHSKFMVLSARRGERCTIECSPNGDRPMRFIWRRNGQIVDPSNEARRKATGKKIHFKLQKPMYDIRTEIIRCDFVDHFFTWPTNLFRNVPSGVSFTTTRRVYFETVFIFILEEL
ncbi:UNVERIFIED_CONTAM: Dscam2 [Trichonephila clavipes]